ncbi:MAG: Gldg family protein [Clostridia bacterium]|nr:Gldg family protein [Clostridia bacterium]
MNNEEKNIISEEAVTEEANSAPKAPAEEKSEEIKKKKTNPFKTEKFRRSSVGVIFTAVFLAVLVVINVAVNVLESRYPSMNMDLTAEKLNTLSDDAKTAAENLTDKVEIFIIGEEQAIRDDLIYSNYNVKYSQLATLCDKLVEVNPSMISVKYVDPDADPAFISEYPDDSLSSGKVLIRSARRYKVLEISDLFAIDYSSDYTHYEYYTKVDSALANALYLVNMDKAPVVAMETAYNEMLSANYRTNLDTLLKDNCFTVKEFNIMTDGIPEDADVVMILTPTTDFAGEDIAKLEAWLEGGEKNHTVFVSSYPTVGELKNLNGFLNNRGIGFSTGNILVETDSSKRLSTSAAHMFVTAEDDLIPGNYSNLISANAVPVEILFDENDGIKTYPLITTSSTVYAQGYTSETDTDPETATAHTAVLAQKLNGDIQSNVIACGDTDSIYAYMGNSTFGNADFMLDLMQYVTDTTDTGVGLNINMTQTYVRDVVVSGRTIWIVGFGVLTVGLPLIILVFGIVVFVRRRHL